MANSKKLLNIDSVTAELIAAAMQCLSRHVLPAQHVAVTLSGGMDSVCLLHVLVTAVRTRQLPIALSALHVHHGLSRNADQWESFCRDYCAALQVPCITVRVTVDHGSKDGLEGAARRVRHEVFARVETDWLMLAHQRDDQAETLLFNLLRGTGLAGAAAMREKNGRLLRPFLSISRDVIECYVRHHGLGWCEDESNADMRHARNFLRQHIFPELKVRFSAATACFASAATRFAEAYDLLDELARMDLPEGENNFPVSVETFRVLSEARGRNLLRYLLAANRVQIPSEARLREALRQMLDAGQDRHPVVAFGGHCLRRQKGGIYLEPIDGRADSN